MLQFDGLGLIQMENVIFVHNATYAWNFKIELNFHGSSQKTKTTVVVVTCFKITIHIKRRARKHTRHWNLFECERYDSIFQFLF